MTPEPSHNQQRENAIRECADVMYEFALENLHSPPAHHEIKAMLRTADRAGYLRNSSTLRDRNNLLAAENRRLHDSVEVAKAEIVSALLSQVGYDHKVVST